MKRLPICIFQKIYISESLGFLTQVTLTLMNDIKCGLVQALCITLTSQVFWEMFICVQGLVNLPALLTAN